MQTIRDRLWIWGHEAGSHNGHFGLTTDSRMTPAEAAFYMGVPNLLMVGFAGKPAPPFDRYALALSPLKRVVWSIIGDASSTRNDRQSDLEEVLRLAEKSPNLVGAIMDDFFLLPQDSSGRLARAEVSELARFRSRLHAAARALDLWVVVYTHDLDRPIGEHLAQCDVATFWTWRSEDLRLLAENFSRLERIAPQARKVLGCYMWDYGVGRPMPLDRMKRQCETAREWLRQGRIEGMIFLASCICDLDLETVEWTLRWIAEVGDEPLAGHAHAPEQTQ